MRFTTALKGGALRKIRGRPTATAELIARPPVSYGTFPIPAQGA
jgi:hypothetical protein